MAFKAFQVEDLGQVTVYKRKGTANLRLSIRPDGTIRVSIPSWSPYAAGVTFARTRAAWIKEHLPTETTAMQNGQQIGKAHRLLLKADPASTRIISRLRQSLAIVSYPLSHESSDKSVQLAAQKVAIRALRVEAEQLLPIRLRELADKHGFQYRSVSIKLLKTRWGSCDQRQNITLNLHLMNLPWQLIDYVLLHELTHTQVMQHGPKFWAAMERVSPNVHQLRKVMRSHQPTL